MKGASSASSAGHVGVLGLYKDAMVLSKYILPAWESAISWHAA